MDERLQQIQKLLDAAEGNLQSARNLLRSTLNGDTKPLDIQEKAASLDGSTSADIIQGIFDGEKMIADGGKEYPVPANYASKSKLVEGDTLKLTIAEDGSFIYKQINPVGRKNLVGTLSLNDGSYMVKAGGKDYKVLTASITFYKAQPGDQVTVIVPADHEANWAALENVIAPALTPEAEPENPVIVEPEIVAPVENTEATPPVSPVSEMVDTTNVAPEPEVPAEPMPPIETPVAEPSLPAEEPVTPQPEPASDPNSPQIEFPAGNSTVSDDELLENLKNNLKNIQTPEFVSPQSVVEETRMASDIVNKTQPSDTSKADQPISELEI